MAFGEYMELLSSTATESAEELPLLGTQNCPKCGKWFERKNTLKRHIRIHDNEHRIRKSRKKNCTLCIRSKVKCSGDRPSCTRCARRGVSCFYEQHDPTNGSTTLQPNDHFSPQQPVTIPPTLLDNNASQAFIPDFSQQQLSMSGLVQQTPNFRDDMSEFFHWASLFPRLADLPVWDRAPSNSLNHAFPPDFAGPPPPPPDLGVFHAFQRVDGQQTQQQETLTPMNISAQAPLFTSNSDCEQPARSPGTWLESNNTITNNKEPPGLPTLGCTESTETIYSRRFTSSAVDEVTYESLVHCLRLPLTRSPWPRVSLDVFPSKDQLDYLIDLYFIHFDQFLPMVHRPTFSPGKDPALTLAMCAIGACFSNLENSQEFSKSLCGLLRQFLVYMNESDASFTRNESQLAAQVLQAVLGKASGNKRLFELAYNNRGIIIANARSMGLFENVDPVPLCSTDDLEARWEAWIRVERSKRLAWCIYLFDTSATYYRNCRPHLSLAEIKLGLPCSTEHWEAASAQAWAALHPWTSVPSSISLRDTFKNLFKKENNLDGVCAENGSGTNISSSPPRQTALNAIPDAFNGTLVSTTLVRSVWDLRESLNEPPMTFDSPASANATVAKNMDAVLSVVSRLTTNALIPIAASMRRGGGLPAPHPHTSDSLPLPPPTQREFRGLVLRARVSLIAQIIAADGVTDHLSFTTTTTTNSTTSAQNGHGAGRSDEQRLLDWARADPAQARRLAYVGARLLAISRLYPIHYPREPFDVLQGGMLVWTMMRLLRKLRVEDKRAGLATGMSLPTPESRVSVRVCQLDWLGDEDASEARTVQTWIREGGDGFVLRMHGVSDLRTPEGERQVLFETADVLKSLRVWGIAKTYLDIVNRALQCEDKA